jgi:hypothetical protein
MKVEKIKPIHIKCPMQTYYKLKGKTQKRCPVCKSGQLQFTEQNRLLQMTCSKTDCTNHMVIPIDTYSTYSTLYDTNKQQYVESVKQIIQKKYDILFKYTSEHDISELRTNYLKHKENYDVMNQHYYETEHQHFEKLKELYELRDEFSKKINPDELNSILNEIHLQEYKKVGNAFEYYTPFSELILL